MAIKRIENVLDGTGVERKGDQAIQRYKYYFATVKIRRGDNWRVRPDAEDIDGRLIRVSTGWLIDDISMYEGEFAMIIDAVYDTGIGWIASGDLTNIVKDSPLKPRADPPPALAV